MKIEIDTKDDIHILRHIINMLNAISSNPGSRRYDDALSSYDSSSSTPTQQTAPVSDASSLLGMFDSSTTSEPTPLFPEKKENRDFIDSLQVY